MKANRDILFHHDGTQGVIAYVPSKAIAFTLNAAAFRFVKDLLNGGFRGPLSKSKHSILQRLKGIGVFEDDPLRNRPVSSDAPFTRLVLLLTRDCNLKCRYCFSRGGTLRNAMSSDIAHAAIDFMINESIRFRKKSLVLSYHGGGEPTLEWELLVKTYCYAKSRCDNLGLTLQTHMTSNCIWTEAQALWINRHINTVTMSFDGPKEVSDYHRPKKDGSSSWPDVTKSISFFNTTGLRINIRATISHITVHRMLDLVDYFHSLGAHRIQLEPLTYAGRALGGNLTRPDPKIFCNEFVAAFNRGAELGCEVYCSFFRQRRLVTAFCGADGRTIVVSPEGNISSCHRVSMNSDQGWQSLFLGRYYSQQKWLVIDESKLQKLRKRANTRDDRCKKCIAVYHCAGGCYAQNAVNSEAFIPDSYRCKITKKLLLNSLKQAIGRSPKKGE